MSIKQNNEITVKIKGELSELYKILEEKQFKKERTFSIKDIFRRWKKSLLQTAK